MKKILLALSAIYITSSSFLTVGCGIDPNPFHYLPTKMAIGYGQFQKHKIQPVGFKNNDDQKLEIDFSPILTFTIKKGTDSFLGADKYISIASQFVNEYEYFDWFNQHEEVLPTINYELKEDDLSTPMVYQIKNDEGEEKSFPMQQIIRIDNYCEEPKETDKEWGFKVTLRKWGFHIVTGEKGIYQETKETINLQIFINGLSLEELKDESNDYLNVVN